MDYLCWVYIVCVDADVSRMHLYCLPQLSSFNLADLWEERGDERKNKQKIESEMVKLAKQQPTPIQLGSENPSWPV